MKMRSFTAENIHDAMQMARDTMGDDAVILTTDKKKGGGVVVTFGLDREDETLFDNDARPTGRFFNESSYNPPAAANDFGDAQSGKPLIADVLNYHGVPAPIQQEILAKADQLSFSPPKDLHHLQEQLVVIFEQLYRFDPLPLNSAGTRIILVGPPGVGKTIAAAKLASKMVMDKKKVHVVSTDGKRAGGAEQLQILTDILGIELDFAQSRAQLKELLRRYDSDSRVIIDSAGCNPYNFQELKELGEFANVQDLEPVLVCAAGTDGQEATEIASVFSFLGIDRVLITRTDCARRYSSLLSVAQAGGYAFCDMTSSAKAMGDIKAMDATLLAQCFTHYQRERIAA